MHHDLIALARGAGVDPVVERRLSDQHRGVGLLLRERSRFRESRVRLEQRWLGPQDIARAVRA